MMPKKPRSSCPICLKVIDAPPSRKRICCSKKCSGRRKSGSKNTLYKGTSERRNCVVCGVSFTTYKRKDEKRERKYCSLDCAYKNREKEKSLFWRGGITPKTKIRLLSREWGIISKSIRTRDGKKCTKCGKSEVLLDVHHVIPYRISRNDSAENLITLCRSCHRKEEHNFCRSEKWN